MFWQMPKKEVDFAHEFARVIQQRLLMAIGLGIVSVVTTAISASYGYYVRELPQSIKSLTVSVDGLKDLVQEEQEANKRQDFVQQNLDRRLERIESRILQ